MSKEEKFELWNRYAEAAISGFMLSVDDMIQQRMTPIQISTTVVGVCCTVADTMVKAAEEKLESLSA